MELRLSDENLAKRFVTSSKCEVCGQFYQEENIRILGHDENYCIMQVSCGSCHSQSLLAAFIDENEDTGSTSVSIEVLTDLMEKEITKFENTIITSDDVLDMFNYLDGFKGNYSQLFEQD